MGGGERGVRGKEGKMGEEKEGVRGKAEKMRGGKGGCEGEAREDGGLCTWHSKRMPSPLFVRSSTLPHSDSSLGTASANQQVMNVSIIALWRPASNESD